MGKCICRIRYIASRGRHRSDTGAYCEYEERKFDVDVHPQGFEREGIKETGTYPPFKITLLISRFAGAETFIRFPDHGVGCDGGTLFPIVSEMGLHGLNLLMRWKPEQRMFRSNSFCHHHQLADVRANNVHMRCTTATIDPLQLAKEDPRVGLSTRLGAQA